MVLTTCFPISPLSSPTNLFKNYKSEWVTTLSSQSWVVAQPSSLFMASKFLFKMRFMSQDLRSLFTAFCAHFQQWDCGNLVLWRQVWYDGVLPYFCALGQHILRLSSGLWAARPLCPVGHLSLRLTLVPTLPLPFRTLIKYSGSNAYLILDTCNYWRWLRWGSERLWPCPYSTMVLSSHPQVHPSNTLVISFGGLTICTSPKIAYNTNCILLKTCVLRVLITDLTYSHVPGDQGGTPFFRLMIIFCQSFCVQIGILQFVSWIQICIQMCPNLQMSMCKIVCNKLVYINLYIFITNWYVQICTYQTSIY